MKMRLSLHSKVLLLVAIPLLIQIGLLSAIANLESQAERALEASALSQRISDKINKVTEDIFAIYTRYKTYEALETVPFDDQLGVKLFSQLRDDYAQLKSVAAANEEIVQAVVRSETATNESFAIFQSLKVALQNSGPNNTRERISIARKIRKRQRDDLIFKRLIEIGKEQKILAAAAPEQQILFREQTQRILVITGILDLALGVVVALILTRGLASRLELVIGNTYRLASNLPLNPVIKGGDEIAHLDRVFHQMARDLTTARQKEQLVIESARDLICTVDANGRLTSANPAAEKLLLMPPEALIGRHMVDIISENSKASLLMFQEEIKTKSDVPACELELKTSLNQIVNVICSARWSPQEESSFWVVHDITERKRAELLRQEILAMVSHDLRTPLSTLKFVIDQFAKEQALSFEKKTKYTLMATRSVERMFNLVNDLLDIEKIKSKKMVLERQSVSLDQCFQTCIEVCAGMAHENDIMLSFDTTGKNILVDEKLIGRVLVNLVSNAIKFAPKHSTVRITSKSSNSSLEVSVEDDGPGVPADQVEMIFQRFHQGRGQSTSSHGGSGLGLTICQAIVQLHGGRIWVETTGTGGKFTFSIPENS
ncbi:MAG: PAS domain S-box protein [Cyanobacteria bacterium SZAS-4]|nr:PAS domain S-box protein [Cyanobacteria bacterium SZAS-4]